MRKSTKAVLLSALVLPGLGQITLKRYKMAVLLIASSAIMFFKMMSIAMEQAFFVVNNMSAQGVAPGLDDISTATAQATALAEQSGYSFYFWMLVVCWVVGIVDAGVNGREKG